MQNGEKTDIRIVSAEEKRDAHKRKEEKIHTMKKFITTSLMTAVAVPFLMAAPAPKKAQNTASTETTPDNADHQEGSQDTRRPRVRRRPLRRLATETK